MKLNRLNHDPGELLEFYDEGLSALGALCERTWHDRLEVVAEGKSAAFWNPGGALHEVELHFAPADATSMHADALREVFPPAVRSRFNWRSRCAPCRWRSIVSCLRMIFAARTAGSSSGGKIMAGL